METESSTSPRTIISETYRNYALKQVRRIETHLTRLSNDDKERLDFEIEKYLESLRQGIAQNQKFLDRFDVDVDVNSSQTLSFVSEWVREWSSEEERNIAHDMLIQSLTTNIPKDTTVWVPRATLGRLVYDIKQSGYNVHGTETEQLFLNACKVAETLQKGEVELQPYVVQTRNELETGDNRRVILVPDVDPGLLNITNKAPPDGSCGAVVSSYLSGQLLEVEYEILWCIRRIALMLPEGGQWINFGPLDYSREGTSSMARALSWEEIKAVLDKYFTFPEDPTFHPCYFHVNKKSMMKTQYQAIYFRCVRNSTPLPPLPQ